MKRKLLFLWALAALLLLSGCSITLFGSGAQDLTVGQDLFLGLLLGGFGVLMVRFPEAFWWMDKGIWYKDAEPSDFALGWQTLGGTVLIVIGAFMLIRGGFGILGALLE